jgi:hypothetical protein
MEFDLFGSVGDLSSPRVAIHVPQVIPMLFLGGVSSFSTLSSPDFAPPVTYFLVCFLT